MHAFMISRSLHSSVMTLPSKSRPWSECNFLGMLKQVISITKQCATVSAFWSGMQMPLSNWRGCLTPLEYVVFNSICSYVGGQRTDKVYCQVLHWCTGPPLLKRCLTHEFSVIVSCAGITIPTPMFDVTSLTQPVKLPSNL